MPEYDDSNIPITCGECEEVFEGVSPVEEHLRTAHAYAPEDATNYARTWADDAYDEIDAHNAWRTEEYRRTGYDPDKEPDRDD